MKDIPALVITDIEGCVIPGARSDWELPPLQLLRQYTEMSRTRALPPLTLCSGRPAQYVEAVGQVIGVRLPMVCENGAVLYDTETGDHIALYTPEERASMNKVRDLMQRRLAATGDVRVAAGKEVCVSLIPHDEGDLLSLLDDTRKLLGEEGLDGLTISRSSVAVDVTPTGIDKASGIGELLRRIGVEWEGVLGVGDGGNDLPFLNRCRWSASPTNGLDFVQDQVDYVAAGRFGYGLVEILCAFTGWETSQ